MDHNRKLVIEAVQQINTNALKSYKIQKFLYDYEEDICITLHNYRMELLHTSRVLMYKLDYSVKKNEFVKMVRYICRTFPNIVLQPLLMEYACSNNFLELAKCIYQINNKNNVIVDYDFKKYFKISCLSYNINIDILNWIHDLNENNIFDINYTDIVELYLHEFKYNVHDYKKLISIFNEKSIIIDYNKLFINACKNNKIKHLDIIAKNFPLDSESLDNVSIYIEGYLVSISSFSDTTYEWFLQFPFIKDVDVGNKLDIFVNSCSYNIKFTKIFELNNEIDISHDNYYGFYDILFTRDLEYIKYIIEKYNIPNENLVEGFKFILYYSANKENHIYPYLYNCIKARNIPNVFDNFDYIIYELSNNNNYVALFWICNQTNIYKVIFNIETKKNEFIKDNGIINIINNLDNYIVSHDTEIDECEICMDDCKKYYVKLECTHAYCRECTIKLYKCPMCLTKINSNVSLLKLCG